MTAVADSLKQVPLFAELNGRQLKKLASQFRERSFQPGTAVVQEGKMSGVGFFVIVEGEAVVSVRGKDVSTLTAGDDFGEVALVGEAERTATVTARTSFAASRSRSGISASSRSRIPTSPGSCSSTSSEFLGKRGLRTLRLHPVVAQ